MAEPPLSLPPPGDGPVEVLFIAGEHSGDQHAALIARDIQSRFPEWKMAAVGGPALQRAGVQLLYDLTRDSVVGLVEVLRHYGKFKALFDSLLEWVATHRPKVVVLVDYPGFNLRFAAALGKRGLSRKGGGHTALYQYVSPQIWAWKGGRRFKMAEILDELGVIFPFEVECYRDTDLPVHFVGHPFAREDYRNPLRYDSEGPVLLLPGSRRQAVGRIFPVMIKAVQAFQRSAGNRPCVCLYPSQEVRGILEHELGRSGLESTALSLRPVEQGTEASAVLSSSGTMSLNCALAGIPGAIVYRAHPLTAWMGRRLIRVEWLGIANLVLKREMYPEYIQEAARPERLSEVLKTAISDPAQRERFLQDAASLDSNLRAERSESVVARLAALIHQA